MAETTGIEWCDSTWNGWMGCTRVSPACDDCYAARSTPARTMGITWGAGQPRQRTSEANWRQPLAWQRQAQAFHAEHGRRRRVFCASLSDWLDNEVPIEWLVDLLDLIRLTPDLDWLLLSKRIGNWRKRLAEAHSFCASASDSSAFYGFTGAWLLGQPPANVWLGATVVNQDEADRDIPKLLAAPARVRFLSIEPMLGPIDLLATGDVLCRCEGCLSMAAKHPNDPGLQRIDWVICGGESGPKARPMHPDWARALRDQCAAAGVPFHLKQWGEHTPGQPAPHPDHPDDTASAWRLDQRGQRWHDPAETIATMAPVKFLRVGKAAAGRELDGRTHDEFPESAAR